MRKEREGGKGEREGGERGEGRKGESGKEGGNGREGRCNDESTSELSVRKQVSAGGNCGVDWCYSREVQKNHCAIIFEINFNLKNN